MRRASNIDIKIRKISIHFFVLAILVLPVFVQTQASTQNPPPPPNTNLIVCNTQFNSSSGAFNDPCTFNSLLTLAKNLINFLIYIAIPLVAFTFAWAGFKILTSGGNTSRMEEGKKILEKVAYGLLFLLAAWLIVNVLLSSLLNTGYSLLG